MRIIDKNKINIYNSDIGLGQEAHGALAIFLGEK